MVLHKDQERTNTERQRGIQTLNIVFLCAGFTYREIECYLCHVKLTTSSVTATDLTPGAELRDVKYPTMPFRSCLQSIGRFRWHTVNRVWNTALATASVTLTGKDVWNDILIQNMQNNIRKSCFLSDYTLRNSV